MKRTWAIALGIAVFAFLVRVWAVDVIPPSLSWDEVSIGYNAYSILKTGKDEHGRYLPLDTFTAFGDYKPPIPVYLTALSVMVFGLTELAVRFPSVAAGSVTVFISYLLVIELFRVVGGKIREDGVHLVALITSILLAISPWHILLSRAGFEANIALVFIVSGIYVLLKATHEPRLLPIAWLPFVAAVYTFNSARYFVGVFGIMVLLFFRHIFLKNKRAACLGFIVAAFSLVPIVPHLISPESRLRFREVNIFSDSSIVLTSNARISEEGNTWLAHLLHNRRIGYARNYLIHFFDHVQPWFLFIRGDGNPKFSIQDVGQLYLIEAPLLFLGIVWLFMFHRRLGFFLFVWLLAAIIPAAVARETPHALRIENTLPVWQIWISYAIVRMIERWKGGIRTAGVAAIIVLYTGSFLYLQHNYYRHYPAEFSGEWQWGYREAIEYIAASGQRYKRIVMSESIGRPYIYVAFYTAYDPDTFRRDVEGSFDAAGFYNVQGLGRYRFIRSGAGNLESDTLYVLPPAEVPSGAKILKVIPKLNGEAVLTVFEKP